jgi:SsrA-binding protein
MRHRTGRGDVSAKKAKKAEGAGARDGPRPVAENRKARHRFHVLETFEAGISLTGNEVKSIRQGGMSLSESYARVRGREVYLVDCHIAPYDRTGFDRPDPRRERKLLLKTPEIKRVASRVIERGYTLVPLKAYFKGPWAKVLVALARGKGHADKRAEIRKREHARAMSRAMAGRRRGGSGGRKRGGKGR